MENPTVRIDGERIKAIRLDKGLTQLYVASCVGVTTDTISRWENGRIPSIKRENAIKLAEALGVELDDIRPRKVLEEAPGLEESNEPATRAGAADGEVASNGSGHDTLGPGQAGETSRGLSLAKILALAVAVLSVLVVALAAFFKYGELTGGVEPGDIELTRVLPEHALAGQLIPVLIEVDSFAPEGLSMIVTETIPPGSIPVSSLPPYRKFKQDEHTLKWIYRTNEADTAIAFVLKLPKPPTAVPSVRFSGGFRIKSGLVAASGETSGASLVRIGNCHWADLDCDGAIDDDEILNVYDRYGDVDIFTPLLTEVEEIWTEGGYRVEDGGRIVPTQKGGIR